MKKFVVLAGLGLAALFVALPERAVAQYRLGGVARIGNIGGIGGINWSPGGIFWRGYSVSGWSPRVYRGTYSYGYPVYYPQYSNGYTAYYPQEQEVDTNAVTIRMHVPSGARVWLEGKETSQSGADRMFVSPSLEPGYEYVYHIRVQWDQNGQTVQRNREVTVHAGDLINLSIVK
jgi:uncharacterized protein (TIGR03000 family)